MMARLGEATRPASASDALVHARSRAANVPDLLVEARRVANTVIVGWHGRRKRGIGENFWQFRPYAQGESATRIDWRRSAREDHAYYVRDHEWEAAHTVWLWADSSASMLYKSSLARGSKEARALVIVLAMAELLSRGGERIAWPGVTDPFSARNGAERLAARLTHSVERADKPDLSIVARFCDVVVASDFLDPLEETQAWLDALARRGARAHLVEVADPAEESFPYAGRTEFRDPESGETLTAGRAETLAEDYRGLYVARREALAQWATRLGWSYSVSRTDRPASEALIRLHTALSSDSDLAARARG